ncbi:MAG: FkbM family methyltransferase, partial [Selenomonas bovis]|nr:FkbM family methyltransferase [Selenomonas bovis]
MKAHQSWPFNLVQDFRYGKLIYNQLDTYIGKSIKLYGEFSRGEAVLFDDLIHEGDTVVEAGANIGSHTVHFARLVGAGGEVYAFEPQRLVYQLLCGNVAINSLANVYTYRCGIGSEPGTLHVPDLSPEQIHNWGGVSLLGQEQGEEVPLVTIDSYHFQACDFIKIDVEGME